MARSPRLPLAPVVLLFLASLVGGWLLVRAEARMLAVEAKNRLTQAEELRGEVERGERTGEAAAQALAKAERRAERAAQKSARSQALDRVAPRAALGMAPALTLLLACFLPGVQRALRAWPAGQLAALAAGVAVWSLVVPAEGYFSAERFDAYWPAILGAVAAAAVLAGRAETSPGRLGGAGLAVWLLLWIPFDLRWYRDLWLGPPELGYAVFALLVSLGGVLAFAVAGRQDTVGVRPPSGLDLLPAGALLLLVGVTVLPVGLLTGFLSLSAPAMGPVDALVVGIGLALTVALPEELFFRGILDAGLRKHFRRPWASLLVSSLAFGLMHWNNRDDLTEQVLYVLLASVAGAIYGLAFRKTKGLWAPVLVHTLVDLIWQAVLRG